MYPIQMKLKKNDKVVSVYNISVGVNRTTSIATYYDGENWYTTNVTKHNIEDMFNFLRGRNGMD